MANEELRGHLLRCVNCSVEQVWRSAVEASKYLGEDGEAALADATYPGMGRSYRPFVSFIAMEAAVDAGFLKPLETYSEGRPGPITWELMRALLELGEPGWKVASKHVYEGCRTVVGLAIEAAKRLGPAGVEAISKAVTSSSSHECRMLAIDAAEGLGATGLPVFEAASTVYDELGLYAIKALARLPDGAGIPLLKKNYYVGNQSSPKAKAVLEAASGMGIAGLPVLEHALLSYESSEWYGKAAADAIGRTGPEGAALLLRMMDSAPPHIMNYIMHGAGGLGEAGVPILLKTLKGPNDPVPEDAVIAAGRIGAPAAEVLVRASQEYSSRAAYMVIEASKNMGPKELEVIKAFITGNSEYSSQVVSRLSKYPNEAIPLLHLALKHQNVNTKAEAAKCAGELGETGLEILEEAIKDPSSFCPQQSICDYDGPFYQYQLVKFAAIWSAVKIGDKARHIVEAGFADEDIFVRLAAAPFMGEAGIELIRTNLNTARGPKQKIIRHNWENPTPTEYEIEPDIVPGAHRAFAAGALAHVAKDHFDLIKMAYGDPYEEVQVAAVQAASMAGPQGLEILTAAFNTGSWGLTNASISASANLGKDSMPFLILVAEKGDYYQLELALGVAKRLGADAMPFFEKLMATDDSGRLRVEARIDMTKFVRSLGPKAADIMRSAIQRDMIDYWNGQVAREAWEAAIEWGEAGLPIILAAPKYSDGMLAEALATGKFGPATMKDRLNQAFDAGDEKEKKTVLMAVTAWGDDCLPFLGKAIGQVSADTIMDAALKVGKSSIPILETALKTFKEKPPGEVDHCTLAAIKEALYRLDGPGRFQRLIRRPKDAELAKMEDPDESKRAAVLGWMDVPDNNWIPVIYRGAMDPAKNVRLASLEAAKKLGQTGVSIVLLLAMDKDPDVKAKAGEELKKELGDGLKDLLAEVWYAKGVALVDAGDNSAGIEALDHVDADDMMDDVMFAYNKARALMAEGRNEEALELFEKSIKNSPENGKLWYNKGCVLMAMGRNEEALEANVTALKFYPSDGLAWGNKGTALFNLGRFEEALPAFEKSLESDNNDVNALYNKGRSLARLGRFEEALPPLDKALQLAPNRLDTWNEKAMAHQHLGQNDAAFSAFDKALQVDPQYANGWINKGALLSGLKRYDEAIASYDKALAFEPDNPLALFNKGVTLGLMGRYDDGLVTFEKYREVEPGDPGSTYCMARLFALRGSDGDKEKALNLLEEVLGKDPEVKGEAKEDDAFAGLLGDKRFQDLVG